MPAVTPDQGLSLPVGPDVADNPAAFNNFVAGVEPRVVRSYTNIADRTARMLVIGENDISTLDTEDRVEIYNGTNHVSLFTRSMYATTRVVLAQTLTASSSVLQNVTNMAVAFPATVSGAIYRYRCFVFYEASATADIKFAFTLPTGATQRWGISARDASGGTASIFATAATSGTAIAAGGAGVGTVLPAWLEGEMTMGANAGNLQLQAAQNTPDASVTNINERTYMQVWRIS